MQSDWATIEINGGTLSAIAAKKNDPQLSRCQSATRTVRLGAAHYDTAILPDQRRGSQPGRHHSVPVGGRHHSGIPGGNLDGELRPFTDRPHSECQDGAAVDLQAS
jgi:hypothetical protein